MKINVVVYAEGLLATSYGKTAHGLIRGSSRYNVVSVIDSQDAGKDAGIQLDGLFRQIPICDSLESALNQGNQVQAFVVGIAPEGGRISPELKTVMLRALALGLDLISGLHMFMCEDPDLSATADRLGRNLIDVRKPKKREDLHFWSGEIMQLKIPRVAVLGTDCALGKRTTAKMITDHFSSTELKAAMVYTGQTGWLQGWKHGFIFDSTPNDFVCGELENAVLTCAKEENPDIILIEGQSALRNPSGPCGAEFLLSAGAKYVVLQTAPSRKYFDGLEEYECLQPSLKSEIELIRMYGAEVIGITINSENLTPEEIKYFKKQYRDEFQLPVVSPLQDSIEEIAKAVTQVI